MEIRVGETNTDTEAFDNGPDACALAQLRVRWRQGLLSGGCLSVSAPTVVSRRGCLATLSPLRRHASTPQIDKVSAAQMH